ncbi:MAG TPA: ABC transporter permease [Burkholderiaceae bacterium]|jgi:NitT/TauT family transport system permease protein
MNKASAESRPPRDLMPLWRLLLLAAILLGWQALVSLGVLPVFFFGDPGPVFAKVWDWFRSGEIFPHLWVTLVETLLSFVVGTSLAVVLGLLLSLNDFLARLLDPFIKAANAMPRVIFAPIFALWFGLGIWSKVALGTSLVFFIVFFNVFQGVREVSPVVLANVRMLRANRQQLLRHLYLPSAASWVFSSLHNAVGMAFVGAVVGEYLGSARGIGYLILEAEGSFNINTVIAGIFVLTAFALLMDILVTKLERRLLIWQPDAGKTEKARA